MRAVWRWRHAMGAARVQTCQDVTLEFLPPKQGDAPRSTSQGHPTSTHLLHLPEEMVLHCWLTPSSSSPGPHSSSGAASSVPCSSALQWLLLQQRATDFACSALSRTVRHLLYTVMEMMMSEAGGRGAGNRGAQDARHILRISRDLKFDGQSE